jgi:type I restriction enzyme S subunit
MSDKPKATTLKPDGKPVLTPKLRFPGFRDTQGWEETRLGNVASFFKGKGISKADIAPNGRHPCIRYGELYTRYGEVIDDVFSRTDVADADLFFSQSNDVIIPGSGETKLDIAKASCMMQDEVALGSDLNVIRTGHNGVFLSYYFNGPKRRDIAKVAQGDTVVHLYPSQLEKLAIALPKLPEQQKIAECLSSVDELIAAQARKLDALKTHKKGLMQQLFPREGETQPRLRFPEFQDAGEWRCKTLKDIADISSGTTPARSNPEFFDGGSIPWVKTTDLNNSIIIETEEKITPKARARVNPAGSILVAMYGGFNQIGRTGCLSVPAATNQAISVLVVDRKIALPVYVLAWLNAKVEYWKRIASSSRKDPNITGSDIGKFPITLPKTQEQQRIADCLTTLDDIIAAQSQKLEALKTHKKGLMQQLFPSPEAVEA